MHIDSALLDCRCVAVAFLVLGILAIEKRPAQAQIADQPPLKVKFTGEGKPWSEVFKWLGDVTGKPVGADFFPSGKFPCLGLPNKLYTIPEVIDILNQGIESAHQTQKYLLLSSERSFSGQTHLNAGTLLGVQ